MEWRLGEIDEGACRRLGRELGVHPVTARCLVGRGLADPARAGAYLKPRLQDLRPPEGLVGFPEAVARLVAAVRHGERVGIFGDYDVDGVTATALLVSFLRDVGGDVIARVARRDGGYGFGVADAEWLAAQGSRVVVTVDCGTSDLDAIAACRARGIDVIVIDHHQVPERPDHPAHALVNPHRPDSTYPFCGLASVGLGFFLAAATRTALRAAGWFVARGEPDVRALLDLVALGTVADMAPLTDENRVLVASGLRELGARRRPGLAMLLERAGVEGSQALTEIDIGWKIGPRLNAPGRLGDATPALELLLASTADAGEAAASTCEESNTRRRALQEHATEEALRQAEPYADDAAITVAGAGWHPGVVGIVAAKLVDRFGKPAAVIALDEASGQGRGSLRSAGGVHLFRALEACRDHLVRFGGHAEAAGLTVEASRVEALRRTFAAAAAAQPARAAASVAVDAVVELGDVDDRLTRELSALAPFGPGNPEPLVVARGARVRASRRVGEGGAHLKLTLGERQGGATRSAIAFRMGERDPGPGAAVDVAFRPEISRFRGEERVELRVRHLRPAGAGLL